MSLKKLIVELKKPQDLLLTLLDTEQERVQNLLNQLRTTDPVALIQMQTATNVNNANIKDVYVPTGDVAEAMRYEDLLREMHDGFGEVMLNNDDDAIPTIRES
jgi:hypothetical protein